MDFCITNNVLGSELHLLCTSTQELWVKTLPHDTWIFSGNLKNTNLCLDSLFAVEGVSIDVSVKQSYQRMLRTLTSGSIATLPLSLLLPDAHYQQHVRKIVESIRSALQNISSDYFYNVWSPSTTTFELLQPAFIDKRNFEKALTSEVNKSAVISFTPDSTNHASVPVYDRLNTRTGRLTVKSGPHILTLKRELRNIISSKNGAIAYYDFAALETRIVMYEAGLRYPGLDVYEHLRQTLFQSKFPRDIVKRAIIAKMYGQSDQNLSAELKLKLEETNYITSKIRSYLGMEALLHRVKEQYAQTGHIRNRYGRYVEITDPQEHILFNSYVQSTGADVCLLGFRQLHDEVLTKNDCRMLYFLHDAVVIDVPHNVDLPKVIWLKVPGYIQKYPLKLEFL